MKLGLYTDDLLAAPCELLAVGVFSDEPDRGLAFSAINRGLDGALEAACRDEDFKGRPGQTLVFNATGSIAARRVLVFGYGERDAYEPDAVRQFAGAAAGVARTVNAASVALALTVRDVPAPPGRIVALMQALAEGVVLGNYRFDFHRTKDKKPSPLSEARVAFAAEDVQGVRGAMLRDALARGRTTAEAVAVARDLVNTAPNVLFPLAFADRAKKMAKVSGLDVKVLSMREMERQGMGLLLGVGQGSRHEPRLIHLTYGPEKPPAGAPVICLVGKGVTFDAGGLSLKTADGMVAMKNDMGGAAAVFGAMQAIAALAPPCVVHGIIAAVENMPDGNAIRPGDVLSSKKGLTVEIINTDAEGRLALADALAFAQSLGPTDVVDLATLTGACMVALGKTTAGAWIKDDEMADDLAASWKRTGEKFWRMPLLPEQRELLDSDVADLKNLGERWGGAISAAMFLAEFIDEGLERWAHFDIAGPVTTDKPSALGPKGGTGFGVRTLVDYVLTRSGR